MASFSSSTKTTEPAADSELVESGEIAIVPDDADYSVPPTKLEQFKASKWRPIAAFAGAVLIGGILTPLLLAPDNVGATTAAVSTWELSLPASSTMLTELSAAPGAAIRGKVSPVADISGKAPVGGAVARWVVEPGASVRAGQPVVQISSGAASAPALPGESRQIEAEKQQNAAAGEQIALAERLTSTQQKLQAAQGRVERAQANIAKTREVIADLRSGAVAQPDAAPPAPRPRRAPAKNNAKAAATAGAVQSAQAEFDETRAQLKSARADLSAAQKALAPLQGRVDDAEANVRAIESKWDGSLASASDVQAARSTRDAAQSTLKSATAKLESAQKQIPTLETKLAARERALDDAKRASRAANAAAPAVEEEPATPEPAPRASNANAMSIEEASKLVQDALAESRAAAREADRLRALVDAYQTQAQKSNQRITNATENLQEAQRKSQQQMVQTVPRVRFTEARAPADGTVVWIATLAREVGPGQSVFGLSSGQKYQARFEDRSGGWKNARVGQVVSALVAPPAPLAPATPAVKAPSADDAGSPPMPVLVSPAPNADAGAAPANDAAPVAPTPELDASNAVQQGARPVKVRLTRIAPPERATDAGRYRRRTGLRCRRRRAGLPLAGVVAQPRRARNFDHPRFGPGATRRRLDGRGHPTRQRHRVKRRSAPRSHAGSGARCGRSPGTERRERRERRDDGHVVMAQGGGRRDRWFVAARDRGFEGGRTHRDRSAPAHRAGAARSHGDAARQIIGALSAMCRRNADTARSIRTGFTQLLPVVVAS